MATSPARGQTYGHYRLIERIGEGAMGVVYRAHDEVLERDVAIKLLRPGLVRDESTRKRFRQEALTLARLNHPHIETLHGYEATAEADFLVMEYVPGITLADRLARGPMKLPELLNFGMQLASALEEAHRQGVVHRDLKPGNILITPSEQAKVLDFGLARLLPMGDQTTSRSVADTSSLAGTLPYLSPEQLQGSQPDRRSDIYALGVVLYEMATGRRAHNQPSVGALVEAILHQEPAPVGSLNPEMPPELEAIIRKAMDKDPRLRYQSAREIEVDLQRLVSGRNLDQVAVPRRSLARARWLAVAAVGALMLAVAVALVWVALRRSAPPQSGAAPPRTKVVAVLPFEAIGGKAENQALCRGLTELLTARLAQISKRSGVEVVPSSEVRSQGVSSAEDARKKLGVTLVVEGSWNFTANNQVTYSLVDAQSRRNLNAAVVNADLRDLAAAEREVVDKLLAMLEVEVRPGDAAEAAAARPDAYQYYVRGRGYLQDYANPDNLKSAVALFNTAIEMDPRFALAYAALGEAYWRQFQESKDSASIPKAMQACRKAARLNDRLAPVHVTFGLIYQGTGRYEDAVKEFGRALDLDATSDAAYRGLASSYASLGKGKEAEDAYRRAIEMRKGYWGGYSALGGFYYNAQRYDDAAAQFRRAIELAPENVRGYTNLGAVYYSQGKNQQAQELFEKSLTIQPNYRAYSNLGTLYFFQGRYGDAARRFEKALQLNDKDSRMWRYVAASYYWAPGERDKADAAYQHAAEMLEKELKINPRDSKVMLALADCYSILARPARAVELVHRALAIAPSDAENMFRAAEVYEQSGDRASALDWLGKSIRAGYPMTEIDHDPTLLQLRTDPQYEALAQAAQVPASK
jgi:tetratricopeptide (TPR) repeat protein/tRNA A-37 threonylcarbamoyl transferase component Bud32